MLDYGSILSAGNLKNTKRMYVHTQMLTEWRNKRKNCGIPHPSVQDFVSLSLVSAHAHWQ